MSARPGVRADLAPLPHAGTEVWLEDLIGGPLPTVVLSVAPDGRLRLAPARVGGRQVSLPLEEPFTMTYRVREVPCEAPAVLVPGPEVGAGHDLWARLTAPAIRLQRRGAVRVPVQLLVHGDGRLLRAVEDIEPDLSGVSENLSAGGVLVRAARPYAHGDPVDLAIQCGGPTGTVRAVGEVVRCDASGRSARPWRVAFVFREIDPVARERIMRFLFERQRELRRRELEA